MKKLNKILSLVLAFTMVFSLSGTLANGESSTSWDLSKSKSATNLNEDYESTVTLSLPSANYNGNLDVAIVVDASTSSDATDLSKEAGNLVKTLSEYENLNVKVSLTIFGGYTPILYSTELLDISNNTNLTTITTYLNDQSYDDKKIYPGRSGSNLQAGVETAMETLNSDTETDSEFKYLIILSDGAARMYYKDGEAYSTAYYNQDNALFWNSNEDFIARYGNVYPQTDSSYKTLRTFSQVWEASENYINKYGMSYSDYNSYIQNETLADGVNVANWNTVTNDDYYYSTYETATYYAAKAIEAASEESNVIMITYPYHDELTYGVYIESFKKWLASEGLVTRYEYDEDSSNAESIFASVKDQVIELVDEGSLVIDEIGSTDDYDFDFVNDLESIDITVAGTALDKTKIEENKYGFGANDDGTYDFVLTYYEDGYTYKDVSYGECFTLEINCAITIDKTVQLIYDVVLTNPKDATDEDVTYGTYDEYGENGYADLYTNNTAVLYPVDSNGNEGDAEYFNKPTVSYTVQATQIKSAVLDEPDESDEPEEVEEGTENTTEETATTNDSTNILLYSVLLIGSLYSISLIKKKRHQI